MSYILEALKKAQAERQLGNAPTIHAPQAAQVAPASAAASRKPLLIGIAAGVLVASAVAVLALRHQAPVQVAAVVPAPAPVAPVTAAPSPAPAAQAAAAAAATPAQAMPVPVPAARQARSVAKAAPVAPPAEVADPAPVRQARRAPKPGDGDRKAARAQARASEPAPVPVPAPMAAAAGTPVPAARALAAALPPAPAAADKVRNLNELPEAIQREVPRVAFGGYIYSPNPADRLLLIDKMLRHEGEEVAPGLVLEKLLPNAAVMNYRGYRYRVAY